MEALEKIAWARLTQPFEVPLEDSRNGEAILLSKALCNLNGVICG